MSQYTLCWNKVLGTGLTLIIILTLVIVGFYNTNAEDVFDNSPEVNDHFEANGFCEIIVSKLDDNIQINDVEKRKCKNGFDIKVKDVSKMFLATTAMPIRSVFIEPDFIQVVDIRVFCSESFSNLSDLYISNIIVESIDHNSLRDCALNKTLSSLGIHRSVNNDFDVLVHQFPVQSLEILDLSNNSIGNRLNRFFFMNMTNIHEILLSNCEIEYFPSDTFNFVQNTIKLIDLHGNRLTRLPDGFSQEFSILTINQLIIRFNNNPWNCYFDENDDLTMQIECLENCHPEKNSRKTRASEKHDADDVIELQCEDLTDSEKTEMVYLKKQTHNITIEPKGDLQLSITIEGPANAYLVWYDDSIAFNMSNDESIAEFMHCNDRQNFVLNVAPNSTYTFCVLTSSESDSISPFNCVAYYVNPVANNTIDPDLVWITNGEKGMVFGIVFSFITLLMFFGIFLGIFLIRKYPHLLKENKSPYLIDSSNRFSNRNHCPTPSVFSVDDSNNMVPTYITPKNFDYVKPSIGKEIPLDASCLEQMEKQTTDNPYESTKLYWDNPQKLPMPPPTPDSNENGNNVDNEENNNFSDNNNKEMDKQIDLPFDNDIKNKDDDYTDCTFDTPKQEVSLDE